MRRRHVVWAYVVEFALVALTYVVLVIAFGPGSVATFVGRLWVALLSFIGLLFAAFLGFLYAYWQQTDSEFGVYLSSKRAHRVYVVAFAFPIAVAAVTAVLLLLVGGTGSVGLANAALAGCLLAVVNLYTTIVNVAGLMKLRNAFRTELARIQASSDGK